MSSWTYINGIVKVNGMGRTQHEIEYILKTVLDHLPVVPGSENNMYTYLIRQNGYDSGCSVDEFGNWSNQLGGKFHETQHNYIIVVQGNLRDTVYKETYKNFQKWLCRLAKRVKIEDVLVTIKWHDEECIITNKNNVYSKMFEDPSWYHDKSDNWCEYLMWDRGADTFMPLELAYRYYDDPLDREEITRRRKFFKYN